MTLQPIIEQINSMNTNELIELNNIYCSENSLYGEIYANDKEFFETYFPNSYNALHRTHFGNYNLSNDYCTINGCGNVDSFNDFGVDDLVESVTTIAEWCYDNQRMINNFFDMDFDECDEEDKTFELVYELDDEIYTIEIEAIGEEIALEIFEKDFTYSGLISISEK